VILLRLSDGARLNADFTVIDGPPQRVRLVIDGVTIEPGLPAHYALAEADQADLVMLNLAGYVLPRAVSGLNLKILHGLTSYVEQELEGGEDDDDAQVRGGPFDTTLELALEADTTLDSGVAVLTVRSKARDPEDGPPINQVVFIDRVEQLRELVRLLQEAIDELERAGLK